jgi:hypothetical protein
VLRRAAVLLLLATTTIDKRPLERHRTIGPVSGLALFMSGGSQQPRKQCHTNGSHERRRACDKQQYRIWLSCARMSARIKLVFVVDSQ